MNINKIFLPKINNSIFSNLYLQILLIVFLSFSFVFKISISTPAIILLILLNINFKKIVKTNSIQKALNIFYVLIYLIYLLSFLFIKDESSRNIIKSAAFIFLPILFFYKTISEKEISCFILSFIFFQFLHILYVDFTMIKAIFIDNIKDFDKLNNIVNEEFIIDRPYFSLNCLLFITCLKYLVDIKKITFTFALILTSFVIISLFLIAARLAMAVSIVLFLVLIVKNKITNIKISFLVFIGIIMFVLPFRKYAYERIFLKKGEPRLVIWNCVNNIIQDDKFNYFFGKFSKEIVENELIKCYNSKEIEQSEYWWIGKENYNYNTHNQFFSFFVSYGLIGLSLFLFIFVSLFVSYIKDGNVYSLLFVIVFFFQSFFENIFDRQLGISLFIWFSYLFVLINKNKIINE